MTRLKTLLVGLWAACAIGAAQARERVFIMDGHSGTLNFSCDVMGVMPVEGGFTRFIAVITIDENAPQDARAVVKVDANSLQTNESDWVADLKGPDFFDTAAYPEFGFASYAAYVEGPGLLRLDGMLTLRGRSKPISLRVRYEAPDAPGGPAAIDAGAEVERADFGMDAYDLVLSDEVEIAVSGLARPGYPPVAVLSAAP
ncbi:MAG: YceI family protein [Micropepsaceae bacterium]